MTEYLLEMQSRMEEEAMGRFASDLQILRAHKAELAQLYGSLTAALSSLDSLGTMQKEASTFASSLHEVCSVLQKELRDLQKEHHELSTRLRFFESSASSDPNALDEAISFLENHPQYLEARRTALRLRQQKARILGETRDKVVAEIRRLSAATPQADPENSHITTLVAASELRKSVGLLEDVYLQDVLAEVQRWRSACVTLSPPQQQLDDPKSYLKGLVDQCCKQYDVVSSVFASVRSASMDIVDIVRHLLMPVVDQFRPVILKMTSLDELTHLIRILKDDILTDIVPKRAPSALPMEQIVRQIMHDAQERLLFRATVLVHEIAAARLPTDALQLLDYPDVLLSDPEAIYPPIAECIQILRKVHPCLDLAVFHSVGSQAIEAGCAACVQGAAGLQTGKVLATGEARPVDANLFLLRNLFYLKSALEQLHFGVIFTEKSLDLSEMQAHWTDLLMGRRSLLVFVQRGFRIAERREDVKRDRLEKTCREAIEQLVMEWTRILLDPLLAHIAKARALQRARKTATVEDNNYLQQQEVQSLMEHVLKHMAERLHMVMKKLSLYLAKDFETDMLRHIVAPLKQNAQEAFDSLDKLLAEHGVQEATVRRSWGVLPASAVEAMFAAASGSSRNGTGGGAQVVAAARPQTLDEPAVE